tara:strand:- start:64 stop:723 length:660 start_codon:yes stop_codon:yes gene_type:complete
MNRIQKQKDNSYNVLISGNSDSIISELSEYSITKMYIENYESKEEAMIRTLDLPDLNWGNIVNYHKFEFKRLKDLIFKTIEDTSVYMEFVPILKSPKKLKKEVFDRISYYKNIFHPNKHINDIIVFNIINPFTKNLKNIIPLLTRNKDLNLEKSFTKDKIIISLVGTTKNNTPYTINLYPSVMYNWLKSSEKIEDKEQMNDTYKKALELQNNIDLSEYY